MLFFQVFRGKQGRYDLVFTKVVRKGRNKIQGQYLVVRNLHKITNCDLFAQRNISLFKQKLWIYKISVFFSSYSIFCICKGY